MSKVGVFEALFSPFAPPLDSPRERISPRKSLMVELAIHWVSAVALSCLTVATKMSSAWLLAFKLFPLKSETLQLFKAMT